MHQKIDLNKPIDVSILKAVMARLVKVESREVLALQVIDGPYEGITFWFSKFDVGVFSASSDGLTPVKFETQIYEAPKEFKPDEAFDEFCGEVLLAWVQFINNQDLQSLRNAEIGSDKIN